MKIPPYNNAHNDIDEQINNDIYINIQPIEQIEPIVKLSPEIEANLSQELSNPFQSNSPPAVILLTNGDSSRKRIKKNNFMKGSGRKINFIYKIVAMLLTINFCKISFVTSTREESKSMITAILVTLDIRCDGLYYHNSEGSMDYGSEDRLLLCCLPFSGYFSYCDGFRKSQYAETVHFDMCLFQSLMPTLAKGLTIEQTIEKCLDSPNLVNIIERYGALYMDMTIQKAANINSEIKQKLVDFQQRQEEEEEEEKKSRQIEEEKTRQIEEEKKRQIEEEIRQRTRDEQMQQRRKIHEDETALKLNRDDMQRRRAEIQDKKDEEKQKEKKSQFLKFSWMKLMELFEFKL